jgi:hypothetical protein
MALVEDVAINATNEMWHEIKAKVEKQVGVDAFREISKMARLFKQYNIGISGDRTGAYAPSPLTPASLFASGMSGIARYKLGSGREGHWPARKRSYLLRKSKPPPRGVGHQKWFLHSGLLSSNVGSGKFWTSVFGPVKVDVHRPEHMSVGDRDRQAEGQSSRQARASFNARFHVGAPSTSGHVLRVNIATVRVAAMEDITAHMLPSIRTGNVEDYADDGRETGLIGKFPKDVAYRLGGNRKFVPYRHTVEPFLGFVLTRAIPNAVARRLQDSLGSDIKFVPETPGFPRRSKFTR